MSKKNVFLAYELHQKIKVYAASRGRTIESVLNQIVQDFFEKQSGGK